VVGELIAGRYELEELVGSGGMSSVYRAHDKLLERTVALKILHEQFTRDDAYVERFRREARAVAQLAHPNIVTVIDRGEQDGRQFIVFEYVDGMNLKELLDQEGPIEPREAIELALQVARGLSFAHENGLVHRDVKPQNVLIDGDGRAKVTDFGIAHALDVDGMTITGTIMGSSNYIAPEQARGEPVDEQSDIYSLGCVLYEMLTGRQPFEADTPVAVAYKHVHEAPTPPRSLDPSIPAALEAVALRAMEKDPAARFPSVAEMTARLDDATGPLPPAGSTQPLPATVAIPATTPLPRRTDRDPRRRGMVPVLALIAVLAVLGALAFALFRGDPPPDGGSAVSPTRSASPSPSPSPSSTPSPPPDSVEAAAEAVRTVVAEGVDADRISSHAEEEIVKRLEEALEKFGEGDTDKALEELGKLEEKVDELIDRGDIHQSQEHRIDSAIEDLMAQMELASPSDEE
jgi:serine/threonine protein kinase